MGAVAAPIPKKPEKKAEENNLEHMSQRLTELETRLVFQDQTIEELHEVIYQQQGQFDELTREVAKLKNRLGQSSPGGEGNGAAHG